MVETLKDSFKRRKILIDHMHQLEEKGIHCFACVGACCTFVSNSMQITPLESYEIGHWLLKQNRINSELIFKLENLVEKDRLYQLHSVKYSGFVRKTYTCPFFEGKQKGCSISRSVKPYGCLGFNPNRGGQVNGGDCQINKELESCRNDGYTKEEEKLNNRIKREFNIFWDKAPIPIGVLEIISQFKNE